MFKKITVMGIKEWLAPHNSEHCPIKIELNFLKIKDWFNRPGTASNFTPVAGKAQEWITSADVRIKRIFKLVEITRGELFFKTRVRFDSSINESNLTPERSEYS